MESGRLYSLITKYWPRIAAGLVVVIGLVEFVVGGMTADSALELYLLAWAGTTGGLWFLFDRGERTLSSEARDRLVAPPLAGVGESLRSIPSGFARLFDRLFGERHWSRRCFYRSAVTSIVGSLILLALFIATHSAGWSSEPHRLSEVQDGLFSVAWRGASGTFTMHLSVFIMITIALNTVPDYVSLLERSCPNRS